MVDAQWIDRLGWTLVHSVWQFAVIAVAADAAYRLLRQANLRYWVGCLALTAMTGSFLGTYCLLDRSGNDGLTAARALVVEPPNETTQPRATPPSTESIPNGELPASLGADRQSAATARDTETEAAARDGAANRFVADGSRVGGSSISNSWPVNSWRDNARQMLQPHLFSIVLLWLIGVTVLAVRPLFGLHAVWRLRRFGRDSLPSEIASAVKRLSEQMGVRQTIEAAQSTLVRAPAVVGGLRPLLLLPATAISGLTMRELESIIAHELAHVRRLDYFVNLIQTMLETIFFFHPAVWLISNRVRQERENCCDDVAVQVCADRATYAQALLSLERLRGSQPHPIVAANGGELLHRVRRLAHGDNDRLRSPWPSGALVMLAAICAAALFIGVVNSDAGDARAATLDDVEQWIEQLSSPRPAIRAAAAKNLRAAYKPPTRDGWDELLGQTKPGDSKKAIMRRFGVKKDDMESGVGTGQVHMESYRLDDRWLFSGWFNNADNTLREGKIVERLRHVWCKPADDYDGPWMTYYVNGQRSHRIDYRKGKYHGAFIQYHANGARSFVQHYVQQVADGRDTGYFPNGEVQYRAFYRAGKAVGVWTWYEKNGEIRTRRDNGGAPRADDVDRMQANETRKAATIARFGGIMPTFDLESAVWAASHIVLVDGGDSLNGEFHVVESWRGDLTPDAHLSLPELAVFQNAKTRAINEWHSSDDKPKKYVTGRRMVLFLVRSHDDRFEPWLSAMRQNQHRHAIEYSVAWVEPDEVYTIGQPMNPGPNQFVRRTGGLEKLKTDTKALLKLKSQLRAAMAIPNVEARAPALRPFAISSSWHARRDAFAALAQCGDSGAKLLRGIIDAPKLARHHAAAVRALATASEAAVDELRGLLQRETKFWKEAGPKLEVGWWNQGAELESHRTRYLRLVATLRALEKSSDQSVKTTVVELRDFWRSLPQLEDKTGLDQISESCDRILKRLSPDENSPPAESAAGDPGDPRQADKPTGKKDPTVVVPVTAIPRGFTIRDIPNDAPQGPLLYAKTHPTWRNIRKDARPYLMVTSQGRMEARPSRENDPVWQCQLPPAKLSELKTKIRALLKVYQTQPFAPLPTEPPNKYAASTTLRFQLDGKQYSFRWYRSNQAQGTDALEEFYTDLHRYHDVAEMGGYEVIAADRSLVEADLQRMIPWAQDIGLDPKRIRMSDADQSRSGWRWSNETRFDRWYIEGQWQATVRQEPGRSSYVEVLKLTTALKSAAKPLEGEVLDAFTNQPLKSFRLIAGKRRGSGWDSGVYNPGTVRAFSNGRFRYDPRWAEGEQFIRIEADGYEPEPLPLGNSLVLVRLRPDPGLTPTVIDAKGKAVAGATAALICPDRLARIEDGRLVPRRVGADTLADTWQRPTMDVTDKLGRFTLPSDPGVQMIAVSHPDEGFAVRTNRAGDGPITLRPWRSVSGVVVRNGRPEPTATITVKLLGLLEPGDDNTYHATRHNHLHGVLDVDLTTKTDSRGRWTVNKLPPGRYAITARTANGQTASQKVRLEANVTNDVTLTLRETQ